jgi:mersacidin/lichenicidin family type 2 lantibiotic
MNDTTVRAWRDPSFRESLTPVELAALPVNPAGETWADLSQAEVLTIVGGAAASGNATAAEAESGLVCTLTVECPWITELWCCQIEA